MSFNPSVTMHANRVFVKELPKDVTREELKDAFSVFVPRIRAARVVDTKGLTNYGFITFDSKEEADQILQRAKSERGILIRGRRVSVDQAFSRQNLPRRNSRQFSQAIQGLCRSVTPNMDAGANAHHLFMHHDYHVTGYQYADQRCAASPNQMHYPVQTSQHYNNMCYEGRPVYMTTPSPGMQGQHGVPDAGQNGHTPYQHASLQSVTVPGSVHSSYVSAPHPGLNGQLYLENPAEGMEAPSMPEWSTNTESASARCAEQETQTAYHHHNQNLSHQMQSQHHHQTQLVQQHLAQQQNLLNGSWMQYAQYHPTSQRRNSDEFNR